MDYVVISKKRKAKYKINKAGIKVCTNKAYAGKERRWHINGQKIYSSMNPHLRAFVIKKIKEYLANAVREANLKPIEKYPIGVALALFTDIGAGNWDLDNLWIYHKCFQDVLKTEGIILEDNVQYIQDAGRITFIDTPKPNPTKLMFSIYEL